MAGAFAALKGATALGYAVGTFAVLGITGIAAVAKNTAGTHAAIVAHDSTSRNADNAVIVELRSMHRDEQINARKQRCVLVAETRAEKHQCEKQNFIEAP